MEFLNRPGSFMIDAKLRSYFLSDLHLFARRSTAHAVEAQLHHAAAGAHTLVLGGDIFDFKWSTRPSLEHSIEESIGWLERLVVSHPRCSFFYLLGNHDCHPRFVTELDRLAFRQPRLTWQPYVLRLDRCVFLHGDIVDGHPNEDALALRRKTSEDKPPPTDTHHWMYDMVVRIGLHRLVGHVFVHRERVLRKLAKYLFEQGLSAEHGIRDVYFGHTHQDIDGVEFEGLVFHNGGASIRGLPFRIIETRLPTIRISESGPISESGLS